MLRVGIIDYGVGNLGSVVPAFEAVDCRAVLVTDPQKVLDFETVVLPGVGSFSASMTQVVERGFQEVLNQVVTSKATRLLGICVGMQLLGSEGEEGGVMRGLGFIPGKVQRFSRDILGPQLLKIPHVGFDEVRPSRPSELFDELPEKADFYFTHSYRMICDDPSDMVASCTHGEQFAAVIQRENIVGAQFHPEKSQTNGLRFLKNFLTRAQCRKNA